MYPISIFKLLFFSDISRLTPIKEQLPEHVSFDHIKLVLAIMKKMYGLAGANTVANCSPEVL
jgi:hypothetical protein